MSWAARIDRAQLSNAEVFRTVPKNADGRDASVAERRHKAEGLWEGEISGIKGYTRIDRVRRFPRGP